MGIGNEGRFFVTLRTEGWAGHSSSTPVNSKDGINPAGLFVPGRIHLKPTLHVALGCLIPQIKGNLVPLRDEKGNNSEKLLHSERGLSTAFLYWRLIKTSLLFFQPNNSLEALTSGHQLLFQLPPSSKNLPGEFQKKQVFTRGLVSFGLSISCCSYWECQWNCKCCVMSSTKIITLYF